MAAQRRTRVWRAPVTFLAVAVVLALVVAVGVVQWSRGGLNDLICDGDCGPSNVIPPRALTTETTPGPTAPAPAAAGDVDPAKLSAAVKPALRASVLGPHVGFTAIAPGDGGTLASSGAGAFVPASTTKVLTAFAALSLLDEQTRFTTRVVRTGKRIVLVGGGDPYLATRPDKDDDRVVRADLRTLAGRTAAALKKAGARSVRLGFDSSLFTGPDASPGWEPSYVPDNIVTPVSALWADQGVRGGVRSRDPARSAADAFAGLLRDRGIDVDGAPAPVRSSRGAEELGRVRSATVGQIVETLLRTSDNQAAEVMLRQLAIAAGRQASFAGGTKAVADVLDKAGIDTRGLVLRDGSGLARRNRVSPLTLAQTVRAASAEPRTSGLPADLPVSGFTGTLVDRFASLTPAAGTIRAKTGTLTGVHSLAGYALDADGRPVVFALMADRSDRAAPLEAQAALDKVAAAIATCRCG